MQQSPPFQLPVPALDPRYGTVLVFDRDTMFVRATPPHEERTLGTGCGQPPVHLFGDGAPRIGNDSYRLRVSAAPSAFVLFAMDAGSANTPLGNGCVQHVGVPNLIGLAGADALGTATVPVPLPWNPALLGLFANAQAAALQANGPFGGFALSPGLSIRVGN